MRQSNAYQRCLAAMLAAAGFASSLSLPSKLAHGQAQNNRFNAGQAAGTSTMEIAKAEGKLEAQQGQRIKISTADQKDVFIDIVRETSVKYTAEAEPSWLVPGLMVRFSTKFDQGKPVAPLKNLEVFMPVTYGRLTMEQIRDQTPGFYQEGKTASPETKNLFAGEKNAIDKKATDKPTDKPADKPANKPSDKAGSGASSAAVNASGSPGVRIVGKLIGVHNNALMIMVDQPVQFELDAAVTISVSAADLTFAMQGDSVTVSGLRNPSEPSLIRAEKLEIKAAKKLAQAQPTVRGARTRTNARSRGNDASDNDSGDTKAGVRPGAKSTNGKRPAANDRKASSTRGAPATNKAPGT